MLEELASALVEKCHVGGAEEILVGVSGGPDSMCLMHALHQLGYPIVVAYFNHQLRPEAEFEAEAVQAAATQLSLPFVQGAADVRQKARERRVSIEQAARDCRYGFLFEEARAHRAQAVAVAHTADDQVETLLMHLLRGSGLNGLTAMSHRTVLGRFDPTIPLVRPLLGIWREATVAYCEMHGLDPAHDPSNESLEYFRNRVRHKLIPELESYNRGIREVLWRTAENLSSDQAVITERVEAEWNEAILGQTADYVAFKAAELAAVPIAIQRHLMRLALDHLAPGEEFGHDLLARAATFSLDESRRREDLAGGVVLIREPGVVYVSRGENSLPSGAWPQMPADEQAIAVAIPGRVTLAGGWQLQAQALDGRAAIENQSGRASNLFEVHLDAESLSGPLLLRARRRGDTFEPLGLAGHSQKLSDFFVNEKLPARARARWPLLCVGESIAWIPGYRPGERFKLHPQTGRAIRIEVSRGP